MSKLAGAGKIEKQFLNRFPKHPLGADMHFASAMTALAGGNYAEALRRLEIVEYRYPKSRLIGKVKKMRQRLEKTAQGGTAPKSPSKP